MYIPLANINITMYGIWQWEIEMKQTEETEHKHGKWYGNET